MIYDHDLHGWRDSELNPCGCGGNPIIRQSGWTESTSYGITYTICDTCGMQTKPRDNSNLSGDLRHKSRDDWNKSMRTAAIA